MFSNIIMKIMEKYPDKYQDNIQKLNKGKLQKAKKEILEKYRVTEELFKEDIYELKEKNFLLLN